MNKIQKIIIIFIITFLTISIFNITLATTSSGINPDNYKPDELTTDDAVKAVPKVGVVLGAIRNISVVVSVIALTIIGLKYIFGSVEEKANYKATMFPYVIGFILAIIGTNLVSFIYDSVH